MNKVELWNLHATTLAELESAADNAQAEPEGSYSQRMALKNLELLEKRLADLDAKRLRWPSLGGHKPNCWCGGCLGIGAGKIGEERLVSLGLKIPESLNDLYKSRSPQERTAILAELRNSLDAILKNR